MPIAPSTENYTTGAMPRLFFQRTGGSEFDLGCISAASIEPLLEFLEHFCSQGGSRTKDKSVVIEKGLQITFNWDEVNVENMRAFLFGDAEASIGEGTDSTTDEEHIIPGEGLVKLTNDGISSVSVHHRLDSSVHFDHSADTYTDFTTQMQKAAGTTGNVLVDGGTIDTDDVDIFYFGHSSKFERLTYDMGVDVVLGTAVVKYELWTGSAWVDFTAQVSGAGKTGVAGVVILDDTHANFAAWAQSIVAFGNLGNSANLYWMRMSYTTADPTTPPDFTSTFHTFVANTDYGIVPLEGYIFRLVGGVLIADAKIDVDYTFTTVTSKRFNVLQDVNIEGQARLTFAPDVGVGFEYFIPRASFKTNGAFEFTDTDWVAPASLLEVLDATTIGWASSPFGYIDIIE